MTNGRVSLTWGLKKSEKDEKRKKKIVFCFFVFDWDYANEKDTFNE